MINENLEINNKLYSGDGVISRSFYLINCFYFIIFLNIFYFGISYIFFKNIVFSPFFSFSQNNKFFIVFNILLFFILFVFDFFNTIKRITDIQGERNKKTYIFYFLYLFSFLLNKYFSLLLFLFFCLKKGKITYVKNEFIYNED